MSLENIGESDQNQQSLSYQTKILAVIAAVNYDLKSRRGAERRIYFLGFIVKKRRSDMSPFL